MMAAIAIEVTPLRIIDGMLKVLTPAAWIKDHLALDAAGNRVPPFDAAAKKFSVVGAWYKACCDLGCEVGSLPAEVVWDEMRRMAFHRGLYISNFNDHPRTTYSEVVAFLQGVRAAVSRLKGSEE